MNAFLIARKKIQQEEKLQCKESSDAYLITSDMKLVGGETANMIGVEGNDDDDDDDDDDDFNPDDDDDDSDGDDSGDSSSDGGEIYTILMYVTCVQLSCI